MSDECTVVGSQKQEPNLFRQDHNVVESSQLLHLWLHRFQTFDQRDIVKTRRIWVFLPFLFSLLVCDDFITLISVKTLPLIPPPSYSSVVHRVPVLLWNWTEMFPLWNRLSFFILVVLL